jgi:hypothetical protein
MITSYLQGGLGNQMFQLAVAYSHAKNHGDEAVFNLGGSHTPHQGENSSKYQDKLLRFKNDPNVYEVCYKAFEQPGHAYCELPYFPNQQLQGFYQSEKFFINHKQELIDLFRLGLASPPYYFRWSKISSELESLRKTLDKPIVSIHIRRGDYLKFPGIHDLCPISYYNQAMDIMEERVGDFHAYFVSDDIEWCRDTFEGHGSFSKYSDELDDLTLMVNSDHNIIANSSFSWWGAYLNTNPSKVVIGPTGWFGPRGPQDTQDIIPENWIKI